MAMSRPGLRASRLAATAMPAAPPPTTTTSCDASAPEAVRPASASRGAIGARSWPARAVRSSSCAAGSRPACDSAHIVAARLPVPQKASTGAGSAVSSAPKAAPCSSPTSPGRAGR